MKRPIVLDGSVVSRLQVARFELEDGRSELAAMTDAGAFKAVKSFHDALETFALALADHVGIPRAFRTLRDYPKLLQGVTHQPFKHVTILNQVEALRTPAKHDAIYPHPDAVQQVASRLDPVFEDNAEQYLGVSFFKIRLASTIRHEDAKREIAAAEEAIEKREYAAALGLLRAALEMFMLENTAARPPRPLIGQRLEERILQLQPDLRLELRAINETFDHLADGFGLVELGISVARYRRFMAITPNVFIPGDPRNRTIQKHIAERLVANHENASFALSFVLETIRRIETERAARHHQSYYRIMTKAETPYYGWIGRELKAVGTLQAGEEVRDAHFSCGADWLYDAWSFDINDQHVLVAFDSCEIVDEETLEMRAGRLEREAMRARDRKGAPEEP